MLFVKILLKLIPNLEKIYLIPDILLGFKFGAH